MFRPKFNTSNAGHSWPESAPGAWEQGKRRQMGDVPRHTHTGGLCVPDEGLSPGAGVAQSGQTRHTRDHVGKTLNSCIPAAALCTPDPGPKQTRSPRRSATGSPGAAGRGLGTTGDRMETSEPSGCGSLGLDMDRGGWDRTRGFAIGKALRPDHVVCPGTHHMF